MSEILVTFEQGIYKCRVGYNNRNIPKEAGFRWSQEQKLWFTQSHGVAARLSSYLDESAKNEIAKNRIIVETWTRPLSVPKGLKLLPFQENAALFALSRNRSYLALDPGLGKTPIAAVIAKSLSSVCPLAVVYICPPFLVKNVEAEFSKWAEGINLKIIPDSMLHKSKSHGVFDFDLDGSQRPTTLLFVDEAHRFKRFDAKRTKALFGDKRNKGFADYFDGVIYLSGTPMPNRPIELFPVLTHSAPETIHYMNMLEYAKKYCAATHTKWGWDFSGASNMAELVHQVIGKFMLRYKKKDVLKDLPPKIEEVVVLDSVLSSELLNQSRAILKEVSPVDLMKGIISLKLGKDELHLSTYRKELGALKVSQALEYIKFILEETDESILIFAIHTEVIFKLHVGLSGYDPLVITGQTPMGLRNDLVKEYQRDQSKRVFIGNIQACGTGFTLTKATRVIFVEFDWVPANNQQASDRAHRIGQDEPVLVQYLVQPESVDKAVIETILRKQKVVDQL